MKHYLGVKDNLNDIPDVKKSLSLYFILMKYYQMESKQFNG